MKGEFSLETSFLIVACGAFICYSFLYLFYFDKVKWKSYGFKS